MIVALLFINELMSRDMANKFLFVNAKLATRAEQRRSAFSSTLKTGFESILYLGLCSPDETDVPIPDNPKSVIGGSTVMVPVCGESSASVVSISSLPVVRDADRNRWVSSHTFPEKNN